MSEHDQETTVYYKAIADFSSLSKAVDQAKAKIAELRAAEAKANAQSLTEQEFLAAARAGQGKDLDGTGKKLQNYKKLLSEVSAAEKNLGSQKSALKTLAADVDKLNQKLADTKKLLAQAQAPAPPAGGSSSNGSDAEKIKKSAAATTAAAVANVAYTQSAKGAHAARAQESRDLDKLSASLLAYASARGLANAADKAAKPFTVPSGVAEANVAYTNLNNVLKNTDDLLSKVSRKKNFSAAFSDANATTARTRTPSNSMAVALRDAPGGLVNTGQQAAAATAAAEAAAADAAARAWTKYAAAKSAAQTSSRTFVAALSGEIGDLAYLPKYYLGGAQAAEKLRAVHVNLSNTFKTMPALGAGAARAFEDAAKSEDRLGASTRKNNGFFATFARSFTGLFGAFRGLGSAFSGITGAFGRIFTEGQRLKGAVDGLKTSFSGFGGNIRGTVSEALDEFGSAMKKALTSSVEFLNFGWKGPVLLIVPLLAGLVAAINPLVAILGAGAGAVIGFGSALSNLGSIAIALPGILSAVGAAVGGIFGGMQGFGGLLQAYKTAKSSGVSESSGSASHAQATSDAREALSKAKMDLGRAYVDTQRAITDAERNLTKAQQNATKAQKDLNDARKQARKDLRDLENEVARSKNTELGAQAAVDTAKEALYSTLADPNSTKGQKEEAQYQYQQSKYDQQDTKQKDKDNAALLAYYKSHGGIEAMPGVQSAEQSLADAQISLRDAVTTLQRAKEDQPYTIYDAKKAVRDAQANLTKTTSGTGSSSTDPWAAFNAQMDKLSPSAQSVAKALIAMGPAWAAMRKNVQENLFSQIVGDMGKLKDLIPVIQDLWGTAAVKIGEFIHKALTMLDSKQWKADLGIIASQNGDILGSLGDGVLALAGAFKDLVIAAGPFTKWFVDKLVEGAKHFEKLVSDARKDGSLAAWLKSTEKPLSDWWTIIKNIAGTIWNFLQAATPAGNDALKAMKSITGGWLQSSEDAKKKGSPFQKWLEDIKPLEKAIGDVFGSFFKWFGKFASDPDNIKKATHVLDLLVTKVGPAIGGLLDTLGKSDLLENIETFFAEASTFIDQFMKNGGIALFDAFEHFMIAVLQFANGLSDNPFGAVIDLVLVIAGLVAVKTVIPALLKTIFGYFFDLSKLGFNTLFRLIDKLLGLKGLKLPGIGGGTSGPTTFTGDKNFPTGPAGKGPGAAAKEDPASTAAAKQAAPRGYDFLGFDEDGKPRYIKSKAVQQAKKVGGFNTSDEDILAKARAAAPRGYQLLDISEEGVAVYVPIAKKIGAVRVNPGNQQIVDPGSQGSFLERLQARIQAPRGTKFGGFDEEGFPLYADLSKKQARNAFRLRPAGSDLADPTFNKNGLVYGRSADAIPLAKDAEAVGEKAASRLFKGFQNAWIKFTSDDTGSTSLFSFGKDKPGLGKTYNGSTGANEWGEPTKTMYADYTAPDGTVHTIKLTQTKGGGNLSKGEATIGERAAPGEPWSLEQTHSNGYRAGLQYSNFQTNEGGLMVDDIGVAKDLQRQGIGKALLELARRHEAGGIAHSPNLTSDGSAFAAAVGDGAAASDAGFVDLSKLTAPAKTSTGVLDGLGLGALGKPVTGAAAWLGATPIGRTLAAAAKTPLGRFIGKALPVAGGLLGGFDLFNQWTDSSKSTGNAALNKRLQSANVDPGAVGDLLKSMGLAGFNDAMDGAAIGENFGGPWGALAGGLIGGTSGLVRGAGNAVGWKNLWNNGKSGRGAQGVANGSSWAHGWDQLWNGDALKQTGAALAPVGKTIGDAFGHGADQLNDFFAPANKAISTGWNTLVNGGKMGSVKWGGLKHIFDTKSWADGAKQIGDFLKPVADFFGNSWKAFQRGWDVLWNGGKIGKMKWAGLSSVFSAKNWAHGLSQIGEFVKPIADFFAGSWRAFETGWNVLWNGGKIGKMKWGGLLHIFDPKNWKGVGDFLSGAWQHLGDWFQRQFDGLHGWFSGVVQGAQNAWNNTFGGGNKKSTSYDGGGGTFSTGGMVPQYRATGGRIFQPKGTDTVPAMLTPGEFVLRKAVVDTLGVNALNKLNAGYFSSGGSVNPAAAYFASGGLLGTQVAHLPGFVSPAQALNSASVSSTVNDNGITINELVVNNPVPERGSVSISRKLRSMAYFGTPSGS